MKRLVYSPYTQAWINSDSGVVDISPYIVSGSVDRKVNQVSSAQLTLRNPIEASTGKMLWTDGPNGPIFHPMDPIIIVMTRLQGHPTQVFTGYVDKSPYYQMYPGVCTIEASCSLKRLLYTQWDSSLPFSQYFLEQFGWIPNGDTGIVNPTAESKKVIAKAGKLKGQFTDGSLGALLYAIIAIVGDWDHKSIWIEALPPQIKPIVLGLYQQIQTEVDTADQQIESLITQILGSTNFGGGAPGQLGGGTGGGTVNSPLLNNDQNAFASIVSSGTGLDPNVVAAWCLSEEPKSSTQAPNGANNWLNIGAYTGGNWSQLGGNWATPQGAGDLTVQFLEGKWGGASSGIQAILKTVNSSPQTQIAAIQSSGWASSGYPNLPVVYDEIVKAGGQSVGSPSRRGRHGQVVDTTNSNNPRGISLSPIGSPFDSTGNSVTNQNGRSPGGKKGHSQGNTSGSANLAQVADIAKRCVQRQQALHCFNYAEIRPIQYDILTGSNITIDCSGFAIACYKAAGLADPSHNNYDGSGYTGDLITHCTRIGSADALPGDLCFFGSSESATTHVNVYVGNGQSVSMGTQGDPSIGPSAQMGPVNSFLGHYRSDVSNTPISAAAAAAGGGGNSSMAAAFSTFINLPGTFNSAEALALTGKRSFIADTPLFPFVEQICQASMRNFMSMPNGNFFAFFPDYFGLFGRQYYWEIHDIEIIDGRIDLCDDPLVTHVAVAGDVFDQGTVNVFDLILTSGIFTVIDAITTGYIGATPEPGIIDVSGAQVAKKVTARERNAIAQANKQEALNFLQKYGCRPYVEENASIRSPFFELFLSFQRWMVAWSKQFQTTFELTFMPELFPGGLVAFPEHGLQVYIEEVSHNFDYVNGFTTTVNVSSPSVLPGSSKLRKNISEGVARKAVLSGQDSPRGVGLTPTVTAHS